MLNEDWPENLVRDLARRRVVIVIGSGVSRHALAADKKTKPPEWKEFLKNAAEKLGATNNIDHIHGAIEDGDLLHACEWLKARYDERWTDFLRSQFVKPKYSPGKLHELIALLDARVIFSLNFDDIYENKSQQINQTSQFIKNYYDTDVCEFLRGDNRYIVKLHGNLSSPANLIFTQEEYARARVQNSLFYAAFDAALMTHTFLFIGCGYKDPDVSRLYASRSDRGRVSPDGWIFREAGAG